MDLKSSSYNLVDGERVGSVNSVWKLVYRKVTGENKGHIITVLIWDSPDKAAEVFDKNGMEIDLELKREFIKRAERYLGHY